MIATPHFIILTEYLALEKRNSPIYYFREINLRENYKTK